MPLHISYLYIKPLLVISSYTAACVDGKEKTHWLQLVQHGMKQR